MIEIKDVTKSYGRQKVLQNVSFEIMEGEKYIDWYSDRDSIDG